MSSGPRPPSKAELARPSTPSILSRAGSPTLPLGSLYESSRRQSSSGEPRPDPNGGEGEVDSGEQSGNGLRQGEFIGSVDCGTTSTRFLIFDQYARIVAEHQNEFNQILPQAGWHEQSPNELFESVLECMLRAVEKFEEMGWSKDSIKGIGITNQRETPVCWSRTTGKPLCNSLVWDDLRTSNVVRHFEQKLDEEGIEIDEEDAEPEQTVDSLGTGKAEAAFAEKGKVVNDAAGVVGTVGKLMEGLGLAGRGKEGGSNRRRKGKEGLLDITGIPLFNFYSAIKLRWMLDHYREVHEAHEADDLMFGTIDSWLVYRLTGGVHGGVHVTDSTNASCTLLMSLSTLKWHPPLLRFFGFRPSILPRIVTSSEIYGEISESAGTTLTGVPIAGIIGDQQAALVGNKCLARGQAKNTYGTGSFLLFNTGEEIIRSNHGLTTTIAFQAGPDAKPVYALEGSIAVAGSAIKWLRDQMNVIEESSEMDKLAGSVEDTGGVYFVTGFSGLLAPYWDGEATGMIIGVTGFTTSAHIARATLEAMCYQSRAVIDVVEQECGVRVDCLNVDGGVTNSDLAMQIQANIGGFKVSRPSMRESTALGSALLAGHALGLFGWDLNEPETLSKVNTADVYVYEPKIDEKTRSRMIKGWKKAVKRAMKWNTAEEEDEAEELAEEKSGTRRL